MHCFFAARKRLVLALFSLFALLMVLFFVFVRWSIDGNFEGIYLVKEPTGFRYELKDQVLLGDYENLVAHLEFEPLFRLLRTEESSSKNEAYLTYRWHDRTGNGYIKSFFPDGRKIVICMGRFLDSSRRPVHGLFVGGGLPISDYENETIRFNQTGMAYWNGSDWHHIWCNANEAITSGSAPSNAIYPSYWDFVDSKVLYASRNQIAIRSRHKVVLDGVPVNVERFLTYKAGDLYFTLAIRFTNAGEKLTGYYYLYGDEPWLGNYGTSAGNVGWAADGLHYFEGLIDVKKANYFGMTDIGNKYVFGEAGEHTGLANFISWHGLVPPDQAYFSNGDDLSNVPAGKKVPLSSKDNRVLFAQWGERLLYPQQSETIIMGIGMLPPAKAPATPTDPKVQIDWDYQSKLFAMP